MGKAWKIDGQGYYAVSKTSVYSAIKKVLKLMKEDGFEDPTQAVIAVSWAADDDPDGGPGFYQATSFVE